MANYSCLQNILEISRNTKLLNQVISKGFRVSY